MKKSRKCVKRAFMMLFALGILLLNGCGKEDAGGQVVTAVSYENSEGEAQSVGEQTEPDTAQAQKTGQAQEPAQEQETGTEGTLCYIRSTGEYYLPDRELTDEEILEIIDCNVRIAVSSQGWTQEKIDEANRRDRAEREAKIKAAGGISEEEAIEIARKTMETDIGEKARELELFISSDYERYGWKVDLFEDDGVVCYAVIFWDKEAVEPENYFSYSCSVNAVDGSIYEACSISGDVESEEDIYDLTVWYEH